MSARLAVLALCVLATTARAQPDPAPEPDTDAAPEPAVEAGGDGGSDAAAPDADADADATPAPAAAAEPAAEPAAGDDVAPVPAGPPPVPRISTGFTFGSYGRVSAGSDLRGASPEQIKIVAHPPRIVEPTYLELQFGYGFEQGGVEMQTVTTLAFDDTLFHYTGKFDAQPALRNMYLEAFPTRTTEVWAGSRMYRGDDIYLFDYWPLDDLNTVGAGGSVDLGGEHAPGLPWARLAAHVGWNRLLTDYQYQTRAVPDPEQGASVITQLNRQRTIGSTTLTVNWPDLRGRIHGKLKVYGELQGLPSGTRLRMDSTPEHLPADWGTTLGVQVGAWGFAPAGDTSHARHVNVFLRWSKGLAAYDELAPPTELDTTLRTYPHASEVVFGVSGAWDTDRWNALVGITSRRFLGAGPAVGLDDGWEYALDVRPLVRAAGGLYAGADLSFQARFPRGLNPTAQLAEDPGVTQIAPMLVYSPTGRTAYARPELRLVYRAAHLNQGALDLYVPDDPRRVHPWVHFLGVQAEWWFNSSYR